MSGGARLRVAFVCQWYAPEPVTQPGWIVDGLQDVGVDVVVITGQPHYPTGVIHPGYSPWRSRSEKHQQTRVRRTPEFADHGRGAVGRMMNYASWAVSSAVFGWKEMRRADCNLVYSSPATAAFGPWLVRRLTGTPYVLQIQDLWPDSVFASGFLQGRVGNLARWLLTCMVRAFYRDASALVVISPGMSELLVERGVAPEKITLVYNWVPVPSVDRPAAPLRGSLGISDEAFVLMYAGNHGDAQGLENVVRGMAMMRSRLEADRDIHLVLVGDGVAKAALRELVDQQGTGQIHLVDPVSPTELESVMTMADAQLVTLRGDILFEVTMPSKLQSIMAAGAPVLAVAAGDLASVVVEAGAGLVVPPDDPVAFANGLYTLATSESSALSAMGERGRTYYLEHMSVGVGASRLATALARVVETR